MKANNAFQQAALADPLAKHFRHSLEAISTGDPILNALL
jgi:hypothetical protein